MSTLTDTLEQFARGSNVLDLLLTVEKGTLMLYMYGLWGCYFLGPKISRSLGLIKMDSTSGRYLRLIDLFNFSLNVVNCVK